MADVILRGNDYGGNKTWDENVVIDSGVEILPDSLKILQSIVIENCGTLNTDINVCDACHVRIKNAGVIDGSITLGDNAKLIQVVSGTDDLNAINLGVNYTLAIEDAVGVSNADIAEMAGAANKIILKNSVLDMVPDVDINVPIQVAGVVYLNFDALADVYGVPLLRDVSGDGVFMIADASDNVLYADVAYVVDGDVVVRRERETDYTKIFNDDMGGFLNARRAENSNDALIRAMDAAVDMNEMQSVMDGSVRFNPDNLLRPIRIIGAFDKFNTINGLETGMDVGAIFSNDFNAYDAEFGVAGNLRHAKAKIGLRAGRIDYRSDVDDFDGVFYGLRLAVDYRAVKEIFVRGVINVTRFDFDVGDVLWDGAIINNPNAIGIYGVVDAGYEYKISDAIIVAPFVGIDTDVWKTENMNVMDVNVRAGLSAGYSYEMAGIKYDYNLGGAMGSDGAMYVNVCGGFWSEYDMAGGDVGVALVRAFGETAYKVSIGGRVRF